MLTAGLRSVWEDEVKVYELLPLRQADIVLAAETNGTNGREFVLAVREKGVDPLAAKPITLDFLLKQYKAKGQLPETKEQLYTRGLLYLCEEGSRSRQEAGLSGILSPQQRLAVATLTFESRTRSWASCCSRSAASRRACHAKSYNEEELRSR